MRNAQTLNGLRALIDGLILGGKTGGSSGGGNGPLIPPANGSWSQPFWYFDPQNVTGLASDTNNGATPTTPLLHFYQAAKLWGTISPEIRQNTRLIWLSSHTNDSDPVLFTPIHLDGFTTSIEGTLSVVSAGVILAGVVPKSAVAGANSLLQATLNGSASTLMFLRNNTHPSMAWTYKSLGANAFSISQPLLPISPAPIGTTFAPAEVNTWANGDSVDLLTTTAINIVQYAPIMATTGPVFTTANGYIYQSVIFDPGGVGVNVCYIGGGVRTFETKANRVVSLVGVQTTVSSIVYCPIFTNSVTAGGKNGGAGAPPFVYAGIHAPPGASISFIAGGTWDADVIIGTTTTIFSQISTFGKVYLDAIFNVNAPRLAMSAGFYGTPVLYGSATASLRMVGQTKLVGGAPAFTSTFTYPEAIATGIFLNGVQTANSVITGSPDVLNGGIATTVANLDAAAGPAGFGGLAFNLGGASIAHTA